MLGILFRRLLFACKRPTNNAVTGAIWRQKLALFSGPCFTVFHGTSIQLADESNQDALRLFVEASSFNHKSHKMAQPPDIDADLENDYDEDADSDFDAGEAKEDLISSSDEEDVEDTANTARPKKRQKTAKIAQHHDELGELDSGDEATIREREKAKQKRKRKGQLDENDTEDEEQGWRARTRAMREREKDEKRKNKLASIKGSTIDVDRLWEEMNKPGGPNLPPPSVVHPSAADDNRDSGNAGSLPTTMKVSDAGSADQSLDANDSKRGNEDVASFMDSMITIKRTYQFAGEVHTEEKVVPKSSAEAQLWLSQQAANDQLVKGVDVRTLRRPLRRISRFDPNLNNLDSIKKSWEKQLNADGALTGPKLNTVEKSKMDWAAHVDQEGLKDELDEHAKAKEGYLGRMDFLGQVEQRREEETRAARLRG